MSATIALRARPAARRADRSALVTGLRLGALFGPAVFGVTAAGVALPSIADALHATPASVTWVLTAHALALGVAVALFGRLSDAWGVRSTLVIGGLVLGAGAVVCLAAPTLELLVAGRFVLASGSGAMMSGALALAASIDPDRRATVLAWFGATMAVFAGTATLAGGVVTEAVSWRVAVVLPVLSLVGLFACLPLTSLRPGSQQRADVLGAALLAVAAAALLVLIQAPNLSLPAWTVIATALASLLGATGTAWRVRRRPEGFVPRVLARDATFLVACAIGFGVFGGLFAAMSTVPQLLVRVYEWSVLGVGTALLPGALLGAVLSRAAGRLTRAVGGRALLAATAGTFAVGLGLAGLTGGAPVSVVTGVSLGLVAFATTQVVLTDRISSLAAPTQRGAALGLLNLAFLVGGAIGSAAAGALARTLDPAATLAIVALLPLLGATAAIAKRDSA
jgi:DHA2 family metal-tetracycline-proton antiporter-like MFS transporter